MALISKDELDLITGAQSNPEGNGQSAEKLPSTKQQLFAMVIDESSSMEEFRNAIIAVVNEQIRGFKASKEAPSLQSSYYTFNEKVKRVNPFQQATEVAEFGPNSYNPDGMTAMYDALIEVASTAYEYGKELRADGVTYQIDVVLLTDGFNNVNPERLDEARKLIQGFQQHADTKVRFTMICFGDAAKAEAVKLGFNEDSIIPFEEINEHTIKQIFNLVSQSILRSTRSLQQVLLGE